MGRLHLWIVVELKLITSMKKVFGVLIFVLFFVFFAREVRADYASSYQDYINKTGTYQVSHNNYLTARANYFASGSLDSSDKAKSATLKMLQDRDNVVTSYLTALQAKIKDVKGMSDTDKGSLTSQINTEISWYNSHNNKLSSAGSLSDLVSDSDQAKEQFNGPTILVIYASLVDLGIANNNYIRGELNGEITTIQAKIAEIKSNQDKDVSSVERLLVDVTNKISRSQDKDSQAKDLVNSIKPANQQTNGANSQFQSAQTDLSDSNSYLKEANQGLLQMITQIKTN